MKKMRKSHSLMNGAIYIMKLDGEAGIRVGIHSTSKKSRETQVRGGLGLKTDIVWERQLKSKAHALAAEALTHLYLAEFESWRKIGKKTIQIFDCEKDVAETSCEHAIKIVETGGR